MPSTNQRSPPISPSFPRRREPRPQAPAPIGSVVSPSNPDAHHLSVIPAQAGTSPPSACPNRFRGEPVEPRRPPSLRHSRAGGNLAPPVSGPLSRLLRERARERAASAAKRAGGQAFARNYPCRPQSPPAPHRHSRAGGNPGIDADSARLPGKVEKTTRGIPVNEIHAVGAIPKSRRVRIWHAVRSTGRQPAPKRAPGNSRSN